MQQEMSIPIAVVHLPLIGFNMKVLPHLSPKAQVTFNKMEHCSKGHPFWHIFHALSRGVVHFAPIVSF